MVEQLRDWDIVSDVGITALGAAAARALDSGRPDALVQDAFAAHFVAAAPVPMPTRPEEIPADDVMWYQVSRFMGVRTKFLDDELSAAGVGQVVILAAGLDCRAFRLDWPQGTTVFELDQPRVLEFKDRVLAERGARARCVRRTVPIDLRDDWATALTGAGFDPGLPTAWLAEGLLFYLSGEACRLLMDTVHRLSAPGSRIAVEHYDKVHTVLDEMENIRSADGAEIDMPVLFGGGPDESPDQYLSRLGWRTSRTGCYDLGERYGRPLEGVLLKTFGDSARFITGTLAE
ncbi:MAG TPA: SAM-dependent methyltransferase [Amycolatopsis sp.]|nr:SAM-dependent methyltransferase [Amycolatopsis sp.]